MIELTERSEKTVRREVFEFDEEFGIWNSNTWTRVTVNGELEKWVPHDDWGEMPSPSRTSQELERKLEQKYQQSSYAQ